VIPASRADVDATAVLAASRPLPLVTISRFLVAYGALGLIAAAVGVAFLVLGLLRVNALSDRVGKEVGGVAAILDRTAVVLDRASDTASGFGETIDGSTIALTTAAEDLRGIVPRLRDLETQANAVNLLGSQPLAPLGGLFGQIAGQIADLDSQLDAAATGLTTNRSALDTNATSLADLATETRALGDRVAAGALADAIEDARWLLVAMVVVAVIGAIVPAAGALVAGLWLWRWRQHAEIDAEEIVEGASPPAN
jgi:hypothetical protein